MTKSNKQIYSMNSFLDLSGFKNLTGLVEVNLKLIFSFQ